MTVGRVLIVVALAALAVGAAALAYAAFQYLYAIAILGAFFADLIIYGATHG